MAEWYDSHRPLMSEEDARELASAMGSDSPTCEARLYGVPPIIFPLSLALLACYSEETAAKVERYRAVGGPSGQDRETEWTQLVADTNAWRTAGYPQDRVPGGDHGRI